MIKLFSLVGLCLLLTTVTAQAAFPCNYVAVSDCSEFPAEPDEADVELLAKLIYAEARGEPVEGWWVVGECVMARLENGYWGDTLKKVINYGRKSGKPQFAAIPRTIGEPEVYAEIYEVARNILLGERAFGDYEMLFFQRTKSTRNWYADYLFHVGKHAVYGNLKEATIP